MKRPPDAARFVRVRPPEGARVRRPKRDADGAVHVPVEAVPAWERLGWYQVEPAEAEAPA